MFESGLLYENDAGEETILRRGFVYFTPKLYQNTSKVAFCKIG
jgi:hypothetical protein